MGRRKRVAFLTIGQSPRRDILEEMRPKWGDALEIEERGALDELSEEEIAALRPEGDEPRLVSRLRNGREVVLQKLWVETRIAELAEELDGGFDFLVLLCTGYFPSLESRTPCLRAQAIVDHAVAAFADSGCRVGILVPLREQISTFALPLLEGRELSMAHASPYSGDRLAEAAAELGHCDVLALHCMGYTHAHKRVVEECGGAPALLARDLVASAVGSLARES